MQIAKRKLDFRLVWITVPLLCAVFIFLRSEQQVIAQVRAVGATNATTSTIQTQLDRLERLIGSIQDSLENKTYRIAQLEAVIEKLLDNLPSCSDFVRMHPEFADGVFLTRQTTPYSWTLQADGSRQLELQTMCRLKRYTAQEASQCLKGHHMAMVGDSLTRYQFASLVHLIELGEYPARFGFARDGMCQHIDENGNATCSTVPNVCNEADFRKGLGDAREWFYQGMGGAQDGGVFNGRLECQCTLEPERTTNMLYRSEDIELIYFMETGWGDNINPMRGWEVTGCANNSTCRYSLEHGRALKNKTFDWEEPLDVAIAEGGSMRERFPNVDIAIYNRGLWGGLKRERADKIMPLMHEWAGDGRCFYKGTTGCQRSLKLDKFEEGAREAAFLAGCGVLDLGHVTRELSLMRFAHPQPPNQAGGRIRSMAEYSNAYIDAVHYQPWVYEELNNLLLNVLCNPGYISTVNVTEKR